MPWFHLKSLSLSGDEVPEIACRAEGCYHQIEHTRSVTRRRSAGAVMGPRPSWNPDAPCEHMPIHTDVSGERYVWALHMIRCECGCDGILASPNLGWNNYSNMDGAYGLDGIVRGLSRGTFTCGLCETIKPSGDPGASTFVDPYATPDEQEPMRICGGCARRSIQECPDCETVYRTRDMARVATRDGGDTRVCQNCFYDYTRCCHCNYSYNANALEYCCNEEAENNNDLLNGCECYTCAHERRNRTRVIRNYSYKPRPEFRSIGDEVSQGISDRGLTVDTTPYMGFELEVEVRREHDRGDIATEVQAALGDVAYLKEDGSIDNGFEIVTHPMTLEYAMSEFNWRALRAFRKDGKLFGGDNCGLHVHVSKAGFSGKAHEYRWLLFWHRNQVAMRALAGRDSSYAQYTAEQRSQFASIVKRKRDVYSERYSAINTNNEHTHEVRVFASTLFVNRLRASLQLVAATVEYTRHLAASKVMKDGGFSWHEFVVWLTKDARRYADLLERIRTVVKLDNNVPLKSEGETWGIRNPQSGYVDAWVTKDITIQEKAIA